MLSVYICSDSINYSVIYDAVSRTASLSSPSSVARQSEVITLDKLDMIYVIIMWTEYFMKA